MKIFPGNFYIHSVCNKPFGFYMSRRLFKKGERVRSKIDGKVMEVLRYIRSKTVEVMWFDLEKKEVRKNTVKEDNLSKAA